MRRRWLARILLYVMLEVGVLSGAPVRSDEVEALLTAAQRPSVVQVVDREPEGDTPSEA